VLQLALINLLCVQLTPLLRIRSPKLFIFLRLFVILVVAHVLRVHTAHRKLFSAYEAVSFANYNEALWLFALALDVLTFAELFDDKVGDQRQHVVLVNSVKQVYFPQKSDFFEEIVTF